MRNTPRNDKSEIGFLVGLLLIMIVGFLFYFALPSLANNYIKKTQAATATAERVV